ncbi:adenine-specific methyltransferase EcoRI family protein [Pseudoflavonifractor sp. 524-17]|uniref:adenine-specific methyltransferase EcoRI family protein n=1 Tax=Pseudoflavonifractor sp. 524-17 TaxID=2304577 RepID=UPI00325BB7CC
MDSSSLSYGKRAFLLIADKPSYKFEIISSDRDGQIGLPDYVKTPLEGNGDFRSPECLALLEKCDIVVTNPPFSLMKEYLTLLINSDKQFLILGNMNHAMYAEIFPYLFRRQVWLGHNSGHFWFRVPDYYEAKGTDFKVDDDGQKWRRMGNICWFTNMDIEKRHQLLVETLYKKCTAEEYPQYDNFEAIHVIDRIQVTIQELIDGYKEKGPDGIEGVVAYGGRLDVRPAYQREYIYPDKDRDEVIRSVKKKFPINVMYWAKATDGRYELMDGQQRTISICRYAAVRDEADRQSYEQCFSVDNLYFFNLPEDQKQSIRDYVLDIYVCDGTPSEVLDWFKIINIAGKVLSPQELRNTSYIVIVLEKAQSEVV